MEMSDGNTLTMNERLVRVGDFMISVRTQTLNPTGRRSRVKVVQTVGPRICCVDQQGLTEESRLRVWDVQSGIETTSMECGGCGGMIEPWGWAVHVEPAELRSAFDKSVVNEMIQKVVIMARDEQRSAQIELVNALEREVDRAVDALGDVAHMTEEWRLRDHVEFILGMSPNVRWRDDQTRPGVYLDGRTLVAWEPNPMGHGLTIEAVREI